MGTSPVIQLDEGWCYLLWYGRARNWIRDVWRVNHYASCTITPLWAIFNADSISKSVFAGVPQTTNNFLCNLRYNLQPSSQRCSDADLRTGTTGACHPITALATLAVNTLAHSARTLYDDALDTYSEVPSLPEIHRLDSWQQLVPRSPTTWVGSSVSGFEPRTSSPARSAMRGDHT